MVIDEKNKYPECVVCGVTRRNKHVFQPPLPSISDVLIVQDELGIDLSGYVEPTHEIETELDGHFWKEAQQSFLLSKYCSRKCFDKHIKIARKKAKERLYSRANRNHPIQEEYPQEKLRQMLIEEEGCCRVCDDNRVLELHHIIPQEFGGKTTRGNCVLLCPTCHALTRGQGFIG